MDARSLHVSTSPDRQATSRLPLSTSHPSRTVHKDEVIEQPTGLRNQRPQPASTSPRGSRVHDHAPERDGQRVTEDDEGLDEEDIKIELRAIELRRQLKRLQKAKALKV